MYRYLIIVAVPVVALLATVWLPFANRPSLWFGIPALMVWSVVWVVVLTLALAALEFSGRQRDADALEAAGGAKR